MDTRQPRPSQHSRPRGSAAAGAELDLSECRCGRIRSPWGGRSTHPACMCAHLSR
ncbi:hypothetical protein BC739_000289 [Kutzneria viridogrisea]|uniref:Uncharacterized protein n=2 Tax=Kutzneria TaxID=43356 RepID=W5WDU5_9PSEU|nr:hypothetical protein [Kutzneria albida]AHH99353.1 hypothetical protein KALB_5993 [Kutzneria albida DSM 43870]MBA8923092.1 hypothetical protein [Kutzneria viridogrisea]